MLPNICISEQLMFERVQEWQKEAERQRLLRGARLDRKQQRDATRTTRASTGEQYFPAPLLYH
jgi:ribosomal protein L15E